jgi:hypothetical protein
MTPVRSTLEWNAKFRHEVRLGDFERVRHVPLHARTVVDLLKTLR